MMAEEAVKSLTDIQQYPTYIKPYQENLQKSSEARGQIAGAREGMEAERSVAREQARATVEKDFAKKFAEAPQRQELEKVSSEVAAPFVPTRDNAQSLAAIFMLTNIAGFAMGAGGKRNAQAAMSGMNGMLEGYQKGRQDLYRKEKDAFDTNIKQLKTRYDMLDRQLKEALETYKTDKQAGLQQAEIAYAQAGADFYKKYADRFGLAAMYEFHKQAYDSANRMWTETKREEERARTQAFREEQERNRAAERASAQTFREEQARINAELRREQIAMSRERLKEQRLARAERESRLGPTEKKEVRGFERLQDEVALLKATFKPEYANFIADAAGDVVAKAKERLQNDPAMAEWWRRYENVALPERHAMFGATLTGKEQQSWRKASVGPGNSSQQIQNWMADKERTLERNLKQYDRPSSPAAGAGAGSQNVENQARASFGSYEPDKYEYGVNPATGKFARRRKE
jgi:hypothetical protein